MMNCMNPISLLSFLALLATLPCAAHAQDAAQKDMIDISAEKSLEWHQDKQLYIARGDAKAIKDGLTIEADLLTAHQRAKTKGDSKAQKQGANDLDLLTAEGKVFIHDNVQKVHGDKALYNMDEGIIKITGKNLKYITKTDIVTAQDSLEYHEKKNIALARGNAIAEHEGTRIKGKTLKAFFTKTSTGDLEIKQLHAQDNVVIVTKGGEVSRGDKAIYSAKKDIAILSGNVRITRGETQLSGDRAAVDFATGQSRLLNKGSGRVRVLLPSSGPKKKAGQ